MELNRMIDHTILKADASKEAVMQIIEEAKKYHLAITVSKNGKTHKFSNFALQFLREKLKEFESSPAELEEIRRAYKNRKKVERVNNG